jgi:ElaB/YqjD/DUF883 family membrane-anchored ribosome-binding protein
MSVHIVLYVALLGPGSGHEAAPISAVAPVAPSVEELRAACRDLNRRTARPRDIDAADVTPELVALYAALHDPNELPGAELVTMRRRVQNRLELARDRLRREQYQLRQADQQAARRSRSRPSASAATLTASFGGQAAEQQNAQALIELITNTIEPDSWEMNGGRGRIIYFSPLHVLVVRSSQEVHEQIGGALGVLK